MHKGKTEKRMNNMDNKRFIEKRLGNLQSKPVGRMGAIASKMDEFIKVSFGDPDFDTPKHVREAVVEALNEGWTHYPPSRGVLGLREAIAEYHSKYGTNWDPDSEVIVTSGSGTALYVALAGTLDPGDEIVVPEPYYVNYRKILDYLGAKLVAFPLLEETNFHPDLDSLKKRITKKTKMILICTPNNPTGTVWSKEELEEVAELAVKNDLLVLSDEIYNEFLWGKSKHYSISSLPGMRERTIICMSFSKTFAMTGWRLGNIMADKSISTKLANIPIDYRPAHFIQKAGVAALRGPWTQVEEMTKEYDRRRLYLSQRLNAIDGIECKLPEGAFYLFPKIEGTGMTSVEFCENLLRDEKVYAYPGIAFGELGEYHIRISLIQPVETLGKVADAFENLVKKHVP